MLTINLEQEAFVGSIDGNGVETFCKIALMREGKSLFGYLCIQFSNCSWIIRHIPVMLNEGKENIQLFPLIFSKTTYNIVIKSRPDSHLNSNHNSILILTSS